MGYRPERKLYALKFEDRPGLEVTMRSLSIDGFMAMARMAGDAQGLDLGATDPGQMNQTLTAVDGLFARFAGALTAWNLEDDDGKPVPATLKGVRSQDLDFILEITLAWMDAIAVVNPISQRPVNGSGIFPEGSLPMEPLSPSPVN